MVLNNYESIGGTSDSAILKRVLVPVVIGALILLAALTGFNQTERLQKFANLNEIESIPFKVTNQYHERDGAPGSWYPWLKDAFVAEPYHETWLMVEDEQTGKWYEWTVYNEKTQAKEVLTGVKASIVFKDLDTFTVTLKEYSSEDILSGSRDASRESSAKVIVKYVRREIRVLTDEDRDELLDTMKVLWVVDDEPGQARYGENYMSIFTLLKFHLTLAGDAECDHMHDGYGFLGHHSALSYLFELSMQTINPKVTLPYWEYIKDIEDWTRDEVHAGMTLPNDFTNFGIMNENYFGATDQESGHIKDGRWAYLEVPKVTELDPEEAAVIPQNAFGYMRSPWSNNNDPLLVRSSRACGVKPTSDYSGRCSSLQTLTLEKDSFEDWGRYVSYAPHGRVHLLMGGTLGCTESFDRLEGILDDYTLWYLKILSFAVHKNLFRWGILSCDRETTCYCPQYKYYVAKKQNAIDFLAYAYTSELGRFYEDLSWDEQKILIDVLCNSGLVDGDEMQASSSYAPEFWPIHPAVERIYQYKKLAYPFDDPSYPDFGTWITYDTDFCYGHTADEKVLNGMAELPINGERMIPTNAEYLEMVDPSQDVMPYIYDNFKYDYCTKAGYEF